MATLLPVMQETDVAEDDFSDVIGDLYTERATSFIYEVKFFADFVVVRPATPTFYAAIRKLSHTQFADDFDEFGGDHEATKEMIRGMTPEFIIG